MAERSDKIRVRMFAREEQKQTALRLSAAIDDILRDQDIGAVGPVMAWQVASWIKNLPTAKRGHGVALLASIIDQTLIDDGETPIFDISLQVKDGRQA